MTGISRRATAVDAAVLHTPIHTKTARMLEPNQPAFFPVLHSSQKLRARPLLRALSVQSVRMIEQSKRVNVAPGAAGS